MTDRDRRTYIKLHDGMPEHPKVDGLSDKAFRCLIETWCWCARNLTDGHVPATTWTKRVPPRVARELIESGLAERTDSGVLMHDYLQHQTSKAQVEHIREVRSAAGKRGGRPRKAPATTYQPETKLLSKSEATPKAEKTQKTEVRTTTETPNGVSAATSAADSINLLAQKITKAYHEVEPMCRFPAVMQVVKKALNSGRFSEEQITAALLRMAKDGRSVTVDALRTELSGFPPSRLRQQRGAGPDGLVRDPGTGVVLDR